MATIYSFLATFSQQRVGHHLVKKNKAKNVLHQGKDIKKETRVGALGVLLSRAVHYLCNEDTRFFTKNNMRESREK